MNISILALATACSMAGLFCAPAHGSNLGSTEQSPRFWEWAQTPPMGWNSYDAFGTSITEDQTLENASSMRDLLLSHGWNYIVVDARWYDYVSPDDDRDFNKQRVGAHLTADQFGRLMPATNRFPSSADGRGFKPLADKIHAMGLKFGFHLMRGIPRQAVTAGTPIERSHFTAADAGDPKSTCSWCPDMFGVRANESGQAWYDSIFRLYAEWGLDFVRVDDLSEPYHAEEIEMIRKAIDRCGRPIVFSTSPGPADIARASHLSGQVNMWRISGDFWDRWPDLNRAFDLFAKWNGGGGPGHFPDGDMLPLGHIGLRCTIAGKDRQTRFTKDEQLTLLSLWALAPSPLMLGNCLTDMDPWTLSLVTNDDVISVNQDPLSKQGSRAVEHLGTEIWIKPLRDGSRAIGLFNRTDANTVIVVNWVDLQVTGKQALRDLWKQKALGSFEATYSVPVPAHGAALLRATPVPDQKQTSPASIPLFAPCSK
ncbi:MAG: glycoside hydrolase family 27 protein [Chthoniobacteraceae bacterium]